MKVYLYARSGTDNAIKSTTMKAYTSFDLVCQVIIAEFHAIRDGKLEKKVFKNWKTIQEFVVRGRHGPKVYEFEVDSNSAPKRVFGAKLWKMMTDVASAHPKLAEAMLVA